MAEVVVRCPHCQSKAGVQDGQASNGQARFRWQPSEGGGRTFLRSSASPGGLSRVKQQSVELTLNGSGLRERVRVLQGRPTPVLKEVKTSVRPRAGNHQRG
jgi:transposase-like protein